MGTITGAAVVVVGAIVVVATTAVVVGAAVVVGTTVVVGGRVAAGATVVAGVAVFELPPHPETTNKNVNATAGLLIGAVCHPLPEGGGGGIGATGCRYARAGLGATRGEWVVLE